ncbi:MAG: YdcF family protein, partial [Firmicutes bacterium]|nr:YdcF family protein [Bacillota bacterium]
FTNYLYLFVLRTGVVDIFNERGLGTQLYSLFEHSVFFIVAYLECVLLGTIVYGLKAARHVPAFDKDYILILGCQIRPDGSLTPLLRSRADRAVEFARMQKEATGHDIVFVPSGGKGSDEIMAEAEAIANYLRSIGIPDDHIIVENKSVNTYENIRNSMDLIREDYDVRRGGADGEAEPRVAFSTTNYHVFRAGLLAQELGYPMEGIGAPTKRYFWINAFIREFIATLVSEKRHHLKIMLVLFLIILLMVGLHYASVLL